MITVSFACNDEHGHHTGAFIEVDFDARGCDHVTLDSLDLDNGIALEFADDRDFVLVGKERFHIENCSHEYHQGNLIWDSVRMTRDEAKRLIDYLFRNCEAQLDEWDESELGKLAESLWSESPDDPP